MGLQGKVAVVTGGGAGIGRSIVQRLAADGARVAALDIRLETAQKSIELAGGEGLAVVCDVSDSASVDAAIAQVEAELGPVDILINNAGAIGMDHLRRVKPLVARQREEALNGGVKTPLDALVRLTDEEWRRMLAIHLDGTFYCTRAAVRSMAARGGGVVVNMSSICGLEGCTGHPHYSAAKAAILGFTKALARELGDSGVTVNAITPGAVDTNIRVGSTEEQEAAINAGIPLGRNATTEEIAAVITFLSSEESGYLTGTTIDINGGSHIH
jgi:3-oxoacyl-[acyl-carrier protein] reductase